MLKQTQQSDPYVRVQVNNVTKGRTEVVNNGIFTVLCSGELFLMIITTQISILDGSNTSTFLVSIPLNDDSQTLKSLVFI
jgi:hypothetical protein